MSRTQKSLKYFSSSKRVASSPRQLEENPPDEAYENFYSVGKNSPSNSRGTLAAQWPKQGYKPRYPSSRPNTGQEKFDANQPKSSKPGLSSTPVMTQSPQTPSTVHSMTPTLQSKSAKALPRAEERKLDLTSMITRVKSSAESNKRRPELTSDEVLARSEMFYREHLFQTFQALKFVKNLPPVDMAQLRQKRLNLPKKAGFENKKTIVFDLDETLVHCVDDLASHPDVILAVTFPSGESVNAGINVRPYARDVLAEAVKYFEVIIFTASHKCYADVVLDYLDPTHELIHHRLYRENCLVIEGVFMKDLRVFNNRRIQDIVIVDNAAYSFGYQLDNGIPIISWHDDPYDKELFNLMNYLKILAQADDVREVNRQIFHLRTFYEDYIQEFLSGDRVKALSPRPQARSPRGFN